MGSRRGNFNRQSARKNGRVPYGRLVDLSDRLAMPRILARKAEHIYRRATLRGLKSGRSTSALLAASLYAACRYSETFRTLKDVASASQVERWEIARYYRRLVAQLDMNVPLEDPIKCVVRIAKDAGISEIAQRRAIGILERARKLGATAGMNPMGLAAAALSIACTIVGQGKGNRVIARAAGVTDVTISNRGKYLREVLGIELPKSSS